MFNKTKVVINQVLRNFFTNLKAIKTLSIIYALILPILIPYKLTIKKNKLTQYSFITLKSLRSSSKFD